MKIGAIVVRLVDGGQHAIPFDSTVPMTEAARKIRDSGLVEIGKKSVPVLSGVALASDTPYGTVLKFKCAKPAAKA